MRVDGIAFCVSSLPEDFLGSCSAVGPLADFRRTALSLVPRKEAIANAAPHTSASAAVMVFNHRPAIPRNTPQTTDKLTNVTPAVTHFMEPWRVTEKLQVAVRRRQIPALCQGI